MQDCFSLLPLTHFFFLVSAFLPVAARTGHVAAVTSAMTHLRVRGDSIVIARCTGHARSTHRARRTVVVGHAHAHALQPLGLQPLVDRLAVRTKIQMASSVGVRASNM